MQQDKVYAWFRKEIQSGKTYDEAVATLFEYRSNGSKSEKEIYETFCYMDDEEWEEIKNKILRLV